MQDGGLAMGTDVVRALVEMITNASDSYSRLERREIAVDGIIEVAAERLRSGDYNRIVVRDPGAGGRGRSLSGSCGQVLGLARGAQPRSPRARGEGHRLLRRGTVQIDLRGVLLPSSDGRRPEPKELLERPATPKDLRTAPDTSKQQRDSGYSLRPAPPDLRAPTRQTGQKALRERTTARNHDQRSSHGHPWRPCQSRRHLRNLLRYRLPCPRTTVKSVEVSIDGVPDASGSLAIFRCAEPLEDNRTMERHSGIVLDDGSGIHEATYFWPRGSTRSALVLRLADLPLHPNAAGSMGRSSQRRSGDR